MNIPVISLTSLSTIFTLQTLSWLPQSKLGHQSTLLKSTWYLGLLNILSLVSLGLGILPLSLLIFRIGTVSVQVILTLQIIDLEIQTSALSKANLSGRVAMKKWGMLLFTFLNVPNLVSVVGEIINIKIGIGMFGSYSLVVSVVGVVLVQAYFIKSITGLVKVVVNKKKKDVDDKKLEIVFEVLSKTAASITRVLWVTQAFAFIGLFLTIAAISTSLDLLPYTLPLLSFEACLIANTFSGVKLLSLKKRKGPKSPVMLVPAKKSKEDLRKEKKEAQLKKKTLFAKLQVPLIGGYEAEKSYFTESSTSQLNGLSYFTSQVVENKHINGMSDLASRGNNPLPTIIIPDRQATTNVVTSKGAYSPTYSPGVVSKEDSEVMIKMPSASDIN